MGLTMTRFEVDAVEVEVDLPEGWGAAASPEGQLLIVDERQSSFAANLLVGKAEGPADLIRATAEDLPGGVIISSAPRLVDRALSEVLYAYLVPGVCVTGYFARCDIGNGLELDVNATFATAATGERLPEVSKLVSSLERSA